MKVFKLFPKFKQPGDDESVEKSFLLADGRHIIGRGDALGVTSDRVSRKHCEILVKRLDELNDGDGLKATLIPRGTNPMYFQAKRGKKMVLLKDKAAELRDGDCFWLFKDSFQFEVSIAEDCVVNNNGPAVADSTEATLVISVPSSDFGSAAAAGGDGGGGGGGGGPSSSVTLEKSVTTTANDRNRGKRPRSPPVEAVVVSDDDDVEIGSGPQQRKRMRVPESIVVDKTTTSAAETSSGGRRPGTGRRRSGVATSAAVSASPGRPRVQQPTVSLVLTKAELDHCSACELPATQDLVESLPSQSSSLAPTTTSAKTAAATTAAAADSKSTGVVADGKQRRPLDVTVCFRNIHDRRYQRLLALAPNARAHDAGAWNVWFNLYSSSRPAEPQKLKGCRMVIQWQTLRAVHDAGYHRAGGGSSGRSSWVPLDRAAVVRAAEQTTAYGNLALSAEIEALPVPFASKCHIDVKNADCLDESRLLQSQGFSVAVLNMANAWTPGGGYLTGAGAQEENLHRRTSLAVSLSDPLQMLGPDRQLPYPIADYGCVYSPDVAVFRGPEADGYPFLEQPWTVAVISAAADRRPDLRRSDQGDWRLESEPTARMKRKIRMILDCGVKHGHDALVLSAFGCGAFGNPPDHVARLFRDVIFQLGYHHRFRLISFAIFDDHNSYKKHNPDGNLNPFIEVFRGMGRPGSGE